jgi:drug/metabolite transporter (DMT)-like permease
MQRSVPISGIIAAFATPIFLGVAPIFGKLAIEANADPFSVAALRTVAAAGMLWIGYLLFWRKYIFIYPAGLLGCVVVGIINGIGSLFYYSGLSLLDASLAQLLNGMYLPLAVLISSFAGQKIDRRTLIRVVFAVCGLMVITGFGDESLNWLGVGFMLANALMFAGTLILSQYVLFEMPSRTVTLYVLSTMAIFVFMVWLAVGQPLDPVVMETAIWPILALGVTTALSRLAMFAGVKFLGGFRRRCWQSPKSAWRCCWPLSCCTNGWKCCKPSVSSSLCAASC